ncbi:MAG: hypothetical protein NW206_07800 [Hyphomonadaceae bacterium]|nr:hypothetical protein [Hyphomonadaceae bacterium]
MSGANLDLSGVFAALEAAPTKSFGAGRAIMFVGARRGEGVTSIACAATQTQQTRPVFAIDLDVRRNDLAQRIAARHRLGPRVDGSLGGVQFCVATDAQGYALAQAASYSFHRAANARLYVGALEGRALPKRAQVLISSKPDYWDAVRAGGALAIVDAPALSWSKVALRVAPHMDGVVLVVSDDAGAAPAALAAKAELDRAGAQVIGLVYTGAAALAPVLDRVLRQAG